MTVLRGRYRLEVLLGRGGMGAVWRATDTVLGREVAVKELLLPDGAAPERRAVMVERALREARAAARVRHPNVIRVHDVFASGGRPWIVMELLSGHGLDVEIAELGPLPPGRVAEVGRGVLEALRAAHEEGVVHRDVKPGNVFRRDDGRVVLTDFGIAAMDDEERITRTGLPIGTPGYIAPERLRGVPAGPPSDLFALGVLLYAALTGAAPFARDEPLAALGAVLTHSPPRPQGPPRLTELIMGLLAPDPARRVTADRARDALADPDLTAPAAAPAVVPRWWAPARVALVAVGVLAVVSVPLRGCGAAPAEVEVVPTVAPRAGTPTPDPAPTFRLFPTLDPSRLLPPGYTPSIPPCLLRGDC
ncbi:serine/threonine-protein kinase [Actinomadura sp. KC216]|uniref:serine/threonine-protein kinase n=1 Tax=Actinomadura sp. KC216 TaxID=2530370 RepID=UPI001A9F8095|nr:serine/threonine-protein kinase [Actinomadura sp. KC216]